MDLKIYFNALDAAQRNTSAPNLLAAGLMILCAVEIDRCRADVGDAGATTFIQVSDAFNMAALSALEGGARANDADTLAMISLLADFNARADQSHDQAEAPSGLAASTQKELAALVRCGATLCNLLLDQPFVFRQVAQRAGAQAAAIICLTAFEQCSAEAKGVGAVGAISLAVPILKRLQAAAGQTLAPTVIDCAPENRIAFDW